MADETRFPRLREFFSGGGLAAGGGMAWLGGPALGLATMAGAGIMRHRQQAQLDAQQQQAAEGRQTMGEAFADGVSTARTLASDPTNLAQLEQLERDFRTGSALAGNKNPKVAAQGEEMMAKAYGGLSPYLDDIETRSEALTDRLDAQAFSMFKDERNAMQKTLADAQARILERDDKFNNFAAQMEQFKSGSALAENSIAEYLGTAIEQAGGLGGSLELLGMLGGAAAGPGGARIGRAAGALLERMASGEKISNDEALKLASSLLTAQKLANERVIAETSDRLEKHDALGVERGWLQKPSFRTEQYPLGPEEQRLRTRARPNGESSASASPDETLPTTLEGVAADEKAQPAREAQAQRSEYTVGELTGTKGTALPPEIARQLALVTSARGELRYRLGQGNDVGKLVDDKGAPVDVPNGVLAILRSRALGQRQRAREIAQTHRQGNERVREMLAPPTRGSF